MKSCVNCFLLVLLVCPILAFSSELPLELLVEANGEVSEYLRYDSSFNKQMAKELGPDVSIKPLFYEPKDESKLDCWNSLQMEKWFRVSAPRKLLYELQDRIRRIDGILSVQPVFPHYPNLVPDDMDNYDMWGLENMNLPEAWDIHQADTEILIAVLDSGCKITHPDLAANIYVNPGEDLNQNGIWDESDNDGIDNDENGFIDDISGWDFISYELEEYESPAVGEDYGPPDNLVYPDVLSHGTHVSGTAAGVTNNGIGVASASWNCKLLPLKCAYAIEDGTGGLMGAGPPLDFISAIQYAVDMGTKIINISYGGMFYQPYQDAITYARENNCLVFTSGGNGGTNEIQYPAGFVGATAVAAINVDYVKASFSNYGDYISLAAPGVGIWSTMPNSHYNPVDYASYNGTSMASPNAAAVAAYIWGLNPSLTDDQVLEFITETCRNIDEENPDYAGQFGAGFVDAQAAVQYALGRMIPIPEFTNFSLDENNGEVSLHWTIDDQGRDDFMGFNLYVNDEFLVSPVDTSYTYQLAQFGNYNFSITALFGEEESSADHLDVFWNPCYGYPFFSDFENGLDGWYTDSDGVNIVSDPVFEGTQAIAIHNQELSSSVTHYVEPLEACITEFYGRIESPPAQMTGKAMGIIFNEGNVDSSLAVFFDDESRVNIHFHEFPFAYELFPCPLYGSGWFRTRLYYDNGNLFITVSGPNYDILNTLAYQVDDFTFHSVGLFISETVTPSFYDNFAIYTNNAPFFSCVNPTSNPYPIVISFNPEFLEEHDIKEIGAFDNGLCVGVTEYNDAPFTEFVTWGFDDSHPGFTEGNTIRLRALLEDDQVILLPIESISYGNGTFGCDPFTKLVIGGDIVSTPEETELIPDEFLVGSAYPNPFNPSISIPVSIPEYGSVRIAVYNLLGQKVYHDTKTLSAGRHNITFDAISSEKTLRNGMYFVSVSYGAQNSTQKIVLMK